MSNATTRNRRRNYLSQPKTQLRIIVFFVVMALVYGSLNIYIGNSAYTSFGHDVLSLELSASQMHDVSVMFDRHRDSLYIQLAVFSFLSLLMLLLSGLLLSHRIGGPIYHMKNYFKGLSVGRCQPRRIHLRKHDFMHDLADAINEYQIEQGLIRASDGTTTNEAANGAV